MARIDLDAARKARSEALGEPLVVVFGGEEFTISALEKPFDFSLHMAYGRVDQALASLLEPADLDRFFRRDHPVAERPSTPDVLAFVDAVMDHYGAGSGEAPASHSSSNGTSGS